ncbi:hypothetical protein [Spiroplasma endosymbiont of Crioceris asparagi]|uniref:hypothetical protein n=1 Tax=Spiroplasma endosymbiont of Crioceris asparagi TaxID=3066286 RepID=UPI0030CAD8CA
MKSNLKNLRVISETNTGLDKKWSNRRGTSLTRNQAMKMSKELLKSEYGLEKVRTKNVEYIRALPTKGKKNNRLD